MYAARQHIPMKVSMIKMCMNMDITQGKSVHVKGLGYFRYMHDTVGVENLEDFDFEKQVKTARVEFIPERTHLANGTYTRALVDSDQLVWIEIPNIIIENSTIYTYHGDYDSTVLTGLEVCATDMIQRLQTLCMTRMLL